MVEGRGPVRCLIEGSRFRPHSLFVTPPVLAALSGVVESLGPEVPVYVASQGTLDGVVGFHLHRGCLAAGVRTPAPPLAELIRPGASSSLLVVLEGLTNHDNLGGIFRNAMAFGADAVLVCPRSCDPLYRRAIRVSLGASLRVPFARCEGWPGSLQTLRRAGYRIVALHPGADSVEPDEPARVLGPRVALVLGTEGEGLSAAALDAADLQLRIPMSPGVDSINVASASAIAMAHFFQRYRAAGGA